MGAPKWSPNPHTLVAPRETRGAPRISGGPNGAHDFRHHTLVGGGSTQARLRRDGPLRCLPPESIAPAKAGARKDALSISEIDRRRMNEDRIEIEGGHMRYMLLIGSDDKNAPPRPRAEMEALVAG